MSRVINPRLALSKLTLDSPAYKEMLERILDQLFLRSGGATDEGDELSSDLDALQGNLAAVSSAGTQTAQDLADANAIISQLQDDLTAAQNSITTLQNDLATANTERATLITDLDAAELAITQLQTDYTDLEARVTALENP